jgi:hypothetical protein
MKNFSLSRNHFYNQFIIWEKSCDQYFTEDLFESQNVIKKN